jgi:endonuclease YncB( thermonuclease family)
MRLYLATAAALALLLTAAAEAPRIVDGDTLELAGTKVRLWGIDAPELKQPGGAEAKAYLAEMAAKGAVACEKVSTDFYGRDVSVCKAGGIDLAAALVAAGLAWDWPAYSGGAYAKQEWQARVARRGIWANGPQPPWVFRSGR